MGGKERATREVVTSLLPRLDQPRNRPDCVHISQPRHVAQAWPPCSHGQAAPEQKQRPPVPAHHQARESVQRTRVWGGAVNCGPGYSGSVSSPTTSSSLPASEIQPGHQAWRLDCCSLAGRPGLPLPPSRQAQDALLTNTWGQQGPWEGAKNSTASNRGLLQILGVLLFFVHQP